MGAAESTSRTNGTSQEEEERKQKSSAVVGAAATIAAVGVAAWGISRMLSDNTDTQEKESAMKMKMIAEPSYVLEGKSQTSDVWSPPPLGRLKMNTDGSYRPTEHYVGSEKDSDKLRPSGYGGILRDHEGNWIRAFIGYIGMTDNQTAELHGIHKGLKLLDKLGYKEAILETDSVEACRWVTRRDDKWGTKQSIHDSQNIIMECRKLMDKNNVTLKPIDRDLNKCAHTLAKIAIKKQVKYEELMVLPDEIDRLVSDEKPR